MNKLVVPQKIMSHAQLAEEVHTRQRAGERGVFTNGCFDLLHLGHVRYLQEARTMGDFLVLALNSDESTRILKGAGRPLIPEEERTEMLAALTCIDYVTLFRETTANALLTVVQPMIYVKGGDYAGAENDISDSSRLPEAKAVLGYGGIVRLIAYLPHHSTTELIAKVKGLP